MKVQASVVKINGSHHCPYIVAAEHLGMNESGSVLIYLDSP